MKLHNKMALTIAGSTLACWVLPVWAQSQNDPNLDTIVVTASRGIAQKAQDTPASIDVIGADAIQTGQLQVNISETLSRVPGLVAQNRQNYAQDIQISSRGFGARSSFGVRGLRLYADGIPATGPDGQGQVSHFDLASAARIEVLRGPFSSLYGNSSGGVISIFTADGGAKNNFELSTAMGSYGTHRTGVQMSGIQGITQYNLSAGFFDTGGYRDHSAAKRQNLNGKFKINLSDDTKLSVIVNKVDMPDVQDPLGLTRAEMEANPRQATGVAYTYNTRKSVAQPQAGVVLDHRIDGDLKLQLTTYIGERATQQFQSIPATAQTAATSPGGVIDLKRNYQGVDVRLIQKTKLMDKPLTLTYGLSTDRLREGRKGFQNFTGAAATPTATGVQGALRRDEDNTVRSMDQYVQAQWALDERWSLQAGLRHSRVNFDSRDNYIVAGNGNDSGAVSYQANSPALGLVFHATDSTNIYASAGKGFETPTLNELAYKSTSGSATGLNLGLLAATSNQWEVGIKSALARHWRLNTAYFRANTANEITVLSNTGGRTVFQNAGATQRDGLEAALEGRFSETWTTHVAATYLNAVYANGLNLPGIAKTSLFADLRWQPKDKRLDAALEWRRVGKIYVNDANTDTAPQVSLFNARLSFMQKLGDWSIKEFVRIDNLTRRVYSGSVIVNEGNNRFFEPAPGRNWVIGVSAAHAF